MVPPPDYITELLRLIPSFGKSSQFLSLDVEDAGNPNLVFSAFAKFMETSLTDRRATNECVLAIEHCMSTNDQRLHNLIVTEVFEGFRRPGVSSNLLLPKARALYDQWMRG